MSEVSFPLSLGNFSPLWRWSSVGDDSSQGWTVLCAERVARYRCDDHTAQYTTAVASANLTFYGTAISVYANATGGMDWSMAIDGRAVKNSSSVSGYSDVLASWSGLTSRQHVLTLTTNPGTSGAAFTLDRADVTVGTGQSGKNVSTSYIDSESPTISYSSGYWHDYGGYPDTYIPPGAKNDNFSGSNSPGDRANLVFNASAIIWYGPCYLQCGPYSVSIDSEPAMTYNGTWDTPTAVAEGCVRFLRSNLDPTTQHAITINVIGTGYVNIDYFQLFTVPGGITAPGGNSTSPTSSTYPSSPTTPPLTPSHSSNSDAGAIAGGVVGGIGVVVIALILFFLWRRRRYKTDRTIKPLFFSREKPVDGEDGCPIAGMVASDTVYSGSFPQDTHHEGLGMATRTPGPETPKMNPERVLLDQHSATLPYHLAGVENGEAGHNTQQPSPAHTSPSHFNPASFDYRPPEKAATTNSDPSALASSRTLGPFAQHENEAHANLSSGDVTRVAAREHDGTTSVSSYPMGSASGESSRQGAIPPPVQQGGPAADTPNISLTQISQDVNRILTHLGRLRITPGEPVEEDNEAHPIHDAVIDDGTSPPEYGEFQHHREGVAETRAPIRAPLPPIPPYGPR